MPRLTMFIGWLARSYIYIRAALLVASKGIGVNTLGSIQLSVYTYIRVDCIVSTAMHRLYI